MADDGSPWWWRSHGETRSRGIQGLDLIHGSHMNIRSLFSVLEKLLTTPLLSWIPPFYFTLRMSLAHLHRLLWNS